MIFISESKVEANIMDIKYNRHTRQKYSLKAHIVLVTKYRKQLLKGSIADDVKQKIFDYSQYSWLRNNHYGSRQRPHAFLNKL